MVTIPTSQATSNRKLHREGANYFAGDFILSHHSTMGIYLLESEQAEKGSFHPAILGTEHVLYVHSDFRIARTYPYLLYLLKINTCMYGVLRRARLVCTCTPYWYHLEHHMRHENLLLLTERRSDFFKPSYTN